MIDVQDLPPDRKDQVRQREKQVGRDYRAEQRERQLEKQVGTGPPADRIGQGGAGPAEGAAASGGGAAVLDRLPPATQRPELAVSIRRRANFKHRAVRHRDAPDSTRPGLGVTSVVAW